MDTVEPRHMRELHKVRRKLSEKWKSMSEEEKIHSIKESAKRMEIEIDSIRNGKAKAI